MYNWNGGCAYDFAILKNTDAGDIRICDGAMVSCTVRGNTLEFAFFSDGTVTRRGFKCEVYITRNEDLVGIPDKKYYPKDHYLYNLDSQKEVQNIRFCKCSTNTLKIQPTIFKRESDEWHRLSTGIFGEDKHEVDTNALVTISDVDGNILYSQEIQKEDEIEIDISNYPEDFVICLERRSLEQYTVLLDIDLTKKETS